MKTAILIAAHNEQSGIARTLRSIGKGTDIFVASDNSTDSTAEIARKYTHNVIEIQRGGKGKAIRTLIERFDILKHYDGFIIIDADTLIGSDTVASFERHMTPGVAGVVGRIESGNRGLVSYWRSIQHYMTAKMYRRGMAAANCIHIMSGTCALWSTEAFRHIEYLDSPVEDMDFTYQIHRKKLGRITYAPNAVVHTQEPLSIGDYARQMVRWFRGYWLTTARYNAPFGRQTLDIGQAMFLFEIALNWARLIALTLVPFHLVTPLLLVSFAYDVLMVMIFALAAAIQTRNWRIFAFAPGILWFYLFDMMLNMFSILTYRKLKTGTWTSPVRITA